jgi:predicted alpha/beta hydrolase family esterase
MSEIIILPGIGDSGDAHWQTRWQQEHSNMRRFAPASWGQPDLLDWIASLDRAIDASSEAPLLVGHSLSCLLVAHWRRRSVRRVAGAFLVAVPDPSSPHFPDEAAAFAVVPEERLDFPSLIIASSDDPYASLHYARQRAAQWGSGLVELGALGHINGASGLGPWQEGLNLLAAFMAGCQPANERRYINT